MSTTCHHMPCIDSVTCRPSYRARGKGQAHGFRNSGSFSLWSGVFYSCFFFCLFGFLFCFFFFSFCEAILGTLYFREGVLKFLKFYQSLVRRQSKMGGDWGKGTHLLPPSPSPSPHPLPHLPASSCEKNNKVK